MKLREEDLRGMAAAITEMIATDNAVREGFHRLFPDMAQPDHAVAAVKLIEEQAARSWAWQKTALQETRNREYYHGLVVKIGEGFGAAARTQDDGGMVEDVLCAKVPELVDDLRREKEFLKTKSDNLLLCNDSLIASNAQALQMLAEIQHTAQKVSDLRQGEIKS